MARLASQMRAGFYPTQPEVIPLITSFIQPATHKGSRVLDPCAGEGCFLHDTAVALNLMPFGVELNPDRAQTATQLLGNLGRQRPDLVAGHRRHILESDYRLIHCSNDAFGLVVLNPPYDLDYEDRRLEYQWLKQVRPWLQPGGILVYIIPQHVLGTKVVAEYIASWFTDVQIVRFPDAFYPRFKQIVLFGRRLSRRQILRPQTVARYRQIAGMGKQLRPLTAVTTPIYTLPKPIVSAKQFLFRQQFIDPDEALAEAGRLGIRTHPDWQLHLAPEVGIEVPVRPVMPLKIGHMAGVIAAGLLNNQVLANGRTRYLLKGRAFKEEVVEETIQTKEDGSREKTTTTTEHIVTDITTIDEDGEIVSRTGDDLSDFLRDWMPVLTQNVARHYPPTYTFNYDEFPQADILNRLSLTRIIPNLGYGGLLPAQKHVVAALIKQLQRFDDALLVGECGSGKTTIGTAVAAGMGARRTLVLCPPHLTRKWKREAKIVWPECQPVILTTISDVQRWFTRSTELPQVGVLATSRSKLGSGWQHAYRAWLPGRETWEKVGAHLDAETEARLLKKALQRNFVRCPLCHAIQKDHEGNLLAPPQFSQSKKKQFCSACQASLHQFQRRNEKRRGSFAEYARREHLIRRALASPFSWDKEVLEAGHFPPPDGYARWPLADVIFRHYKGQIDLAIFDEVHELKGESTDQGFAFAQLVCAAKKSLGLTGTIFGGKASSLFHLLYRLAPDMRQAFTDGDEDGRRRLRLKSWLEQYGVLQEIETAEVDESGKLTGKGRFKSRTKELPGASPAMLPWLLNRAVFLSLMDLGFALPDYEEIPVTVDMTEDQAEQYESLRDQLKEALKQRLQEGDNRLLGAYLAALLYWPDSPWRPELVVDPDCKWKLERGIELEDEEIVAHVPGLSGDIIFPKEQAILDLVQEEKADGRRCVLYCQQTGTRDITPRWLDLFARHDLKAAVLKAQPDKREEWVEKQVQAGIDVIITHPKKVQTGLDLLDFPTLIWMGQEFSVYTVLQASRRSWRIGQAEPVKVYFFQYRNTLQDSAMRLIAAKVAAAIRVNGDTIEGGSIAILDESGQDMMAVLANIAIHGERSVIDLQDAFAQANREMKRVNQFVGNFAFAAEAAPHAATAVQRPRPARPSILLNG